MTLAPFDSAAFRRRFHYSGNDLGVTWSREKSKFRLWAPLADEVHLVLYKDGLGGSQGWTVADEARQAGNVGAFG
ncbi:MAG: hypothetical protein M5U15_14435 [Kiritimatiellae bacterium]|nr:hypothetical protein [Kiritimatiellia bacterium]